MPDNSLQQANAVSSSPKPRSFVANGITWLLISGAVFIGAWLTTYLRYANQRSLLTENVLLLNLFVLPVMLTGLIAFVRYIYRSYTEQRLQEEQEKQQAIANEHAEKIAQQAKAADRRFDHASIIAASAFTPLGNHATEILDTLEKNGPMAGLFLDDALRDQNGHSLITSRIPALNEHDSVGNRTSRIAEILRSTLIDLLEQVDIETLQHAITLSQSTSPHNDKPEADAFYQQQDPTPRPPHLQIHLFSPEALPTSSHTELSSLLREQINASALRLLPLQITLHHTPGAAYPLVDEAISALRESSNQIFMLAGADSLIDESCIELLLTQNRIRTSAEPGGRLSADKITPGESGAAILLANTNLIQYGIQSLATLHRPAIASGDESGSEMLSRAHLHAAADNTQSCPDITQAFCDSPHSLANQNVARALSIALHHLNPVAQRVPVNQAFGFTDMAGGIASMALAAQHTANSELGAICIQAPDHLTAAMILVPDTAT